MTKKTTNELDCIEMKRRGADHVARLTARMSTQEQLEFWRKRTELMRLRQEQQHNQSAIG
ncbi:hypothetical protein [Thiocapsa bogorovii]|uniref:hypothetical protein n=1 Tax=Thiocapsa bogorovii TaxID=521689 RepID=UPI001E3E8286|nr:hypothetical protein [Thiocapsa bogorovii]UHD16693.1 hypothetical protein LT988_01105 [Thiocapsa bogorovii]